jgi:hypothetical protein
MFVILKIKDQFVRFLNIFAIEKVPNTMVELRMIIMLRIFGDEKIY